ncbi:hypothetical protein FH972_025100 [Carpinus fangiana]|uniref:BP28 C-terminal domain-containing protein n=1 Tax=Carpinus fangiana TaxID=176857 RepID=A0A5N6L0E6_9ROSI|nr:hypothetical protein FH972_025100 [Carpinus fangiana]
MSSLQKQLASIAATSNHELDLKAQKAAHGKSLLFDPLPASAQSFETIYQICVEGFEELCALDSRFVPFSKSIFSPQSKAEDRAQMTQADNEELDRTLEAFLGLVGSRLLLKPALKSVEWLVRRFRIQEHNTDYLVLTFLPYHETPVFPTLLSILPNQLSPSFRFLHPYISSVMNPPRAILVQTAVQQHGFYTALNRFILTQAKARHHYSLLLSFWASVIVQATDMKLRSTQSGRLNIQQQRQDDVLVQLLPLINEALALKKAPELSVGCYILIVVLVGKLDLDEAVIDALMMEICNNWTADTLDTGLACLAALAERRGRMRLPGVVVRSAHRVDDLVARLVQLSSQQSVERLLIGLATGFIERYASSKINDVRAFVSAILQSPAFGLHAKKAIGSIVEQSEELAEFSRVELPSLVDAQTTLEPQTTTVDAMDEDLDITAEQPKERHGQALNSLVATLPTNITDVSFLSACEPVNEAVFDRLTQGLQLASTNDELNTILFNADVFQSTSDTDGITTMSFLLRVMCTGQSAAVRFFACHALRRRFDNSHPDVDYQAILPYVLVALSDPSQKVRRAAADLILAVQQTYANMTKPEKASVWSLKNLYRSSQQGWLSTKTATELLKKTLLPALEECVMDADHIGRVLQDSLDDSNAHSTAETKEKRLKSAHRGEIFSFLAHHINANSLVALKYRLITLLNRIGRSGSHYRSKELLPVAKKWVESSLDEVTIQQQSRVTTEDIDNAMVAVVHPHDQEALVWLLSLARGQLGPVRDHCRQAAFKHLQNIWFSLKDDKQKELGQSLVDAALLGDEICRNLSTATLNSLAISTATFIGLLESALDSLDIREQSASKRRKAENGSTVQSQDSSELRTALSKLTLLLELVDSSNSGHAIELFYALFRILQHLQSLKSQQGSDLGYIRGLVLSSLSSMMNNIDKHSPNSPLDPSIARADLLVECIRDSPNAQARNSAVLLLASLAKRIPQKVLHTVMPIFTLISSSTAHQSDDFSIHVVNQTIQEVVPLLAEALRKENKDLVSATAEILLSFAAAFDHIPASRRLQLFTLLVTSLGAEESLFAVLVALVDHAPTSSEVGNFATKLLKPFTGLECLTTVSKYIDLCLSSFSSKQSLYNTLVKTDSTDITSHLVSLLPIILQDSSLQVKIRQGLTTGIQAEEIRSAFARSLEATIKLSHAAKEDSATRAICPRVLEALLKLVPFDEFLKAAQPLLNEVDTDLCRSILRAMELQVRSGPQASRSSRQAALDCTPHLVKILKTSDHASLKHSAVACLDQICEKFGKVHLPTIFEAAEAVSSQQCITSKDTTLRTLCLHCLATTVEVLGNEFIPLLQRSVDAAAQCLEDSMAASIPDVRMHNASYALFIAVVEQIPFVISAKSLAVMWRLSQISAHTDVGPDADDNRKHFAQIASTKLEMGVLCEVATTTWPSAVEHGFEAMQEHINTFHQAIDNHSKSIISKNVRACFAFFMSSLDFRRTCNTSFDEAQALSIEKGLLGTLLALVMKINDAIFRPFFIQLFEWSSALPKSDVEGKALRSATFFNFLSTLSDRLKALVTVYFGYVVDRASDILADTSGDAAGVALRSSVLKALTGSFQNDHDEFWQAPTRFDSILPAIVGQMELPPVHMQRLSSEVIPAIVELAAAANSNEHLKEMNTLLLKQLRSENARVRLATIKCQMQLTDKLGEDWLSLLPEMLPLISELQDDDDERVERETHKWVKLIEGLLGESLDSMLQ